MSLQRALTPLILAALLGGPTFLSVPAHAQGGGLPLRPRRPAPAKKKPPQEAIQKAAVLVNGQSVGPGEVVQVLFGAMGPPDYIQAMRGKQPENDYVLFTYNELGVSFHIKTVNSQNNLVDLIVITQSDVKIANVPFRVGDDYKSVIALWGEPERQEAGFSAYWRRGVYMGVNEQGKITSITIAEPGRFDDDNPSPGNGQRTPLPGLALGG